MDKTETGDASCDTASEIEALVEHWWEEHFPGSPIARVTEAWNHALAAKTELQRRLKELAGDQ